MEPSAAESYDTDVSFASHLCGDSSQAWVALTGELDATAAPWLRERADRLLAASSSPDVIWLDIADLNFVDVAGARSLVFVCDRLRRLCPRFEVRGTARPVRRVLDLLDMELPGERPPLSAGMSSSRAIR